MAAVSWSALLALALAQAPAAIAKCEVRGTVLDGELRQLAGAAGSGVTAAGAEVARALAPPLARSAGNGSIRLTVELRSDAEPWRVIGGPKLATVMVRLEGAELELGAFAMAPGITASGRVRATGGAP